MNFILRRITSENRESNQIIGETYHFIYDDRKILKDGKFDPKDKTPMYESYADLIKGYPEDTHEKVHAFILTEKEKAGKPYYENIPIYTKSTYYIMTENGKTFSKIKRFSE